MKPRFHIILIATILALIPFYQSVAVNQSPQTESIVLGMGCFWGAEKRMSALPGVIDVESGYANGDIEASYRSVLKHESLIKLGLTSKRNHAEVVKVTFDTHKTDLESVLIGFWENHDPTQVDRQGNDIGTNYRSAIYTHNKMQMDTAIKTRDIYQQALLKKDHGNITTEIATLANYTSAETYHQDYLKKNPDGYCGLGGTGIEYPDKKQNMMKESSMPTQLDVTTLNHSRQLIVFESDDCAYCKQFKSEVLDNWRSELGIARTTNPQAPSGWTIEKALFATPTIVLFENGNEVSRFTGYNGDKARFWQWLGYQLLTPEQRNIAFEQGTERAFTGSHLDEKRAGTFIDPISGTALFRSDTKFESGSGWPSFFNPMEGAITLHEDSSHGMRRVEVRSASSGIHLGHVFDDGPAPTHKRYCINGNVLKFMPDDA
ncbi:MAG: peptide-methionine (S)-S-oxide reductase MsrA [Candidatus Thiodiazotropha sp. DIVDIV]